MINTSLHTFSALKLLVILFFCVFFRNKRIFVFFHGGDFLNLPSLVKNPFRIILSVFHCKISKFYFLSKTQKDPISKFLPTDKVEFYKNYSPFFDVVSAKNNNDGIVLLFVGRIVSDKGVFELLEAFVNVCKLKPGRKINLCFAGDGPDLIRLKEETKNIPNVSYLGYVSGDQLHSAYECSSVVCLPSRHPEGFPYVLIESMRFGKPLLASNKGILADYIKNGENGYIVDSPTVAEVTAGLLKLIDEVENNPERMQFICHDVFVKNFSSIKAEAFYNTLTS